MPVCAVFGVTPMPLCMPGKNSTNSAAKLAPEYYFRGTLYSVLTWKSHMWEALRSRPPPRPPPHPHPPGLPFLPQPSHLLFCFDEETEAGLQGTRAKERATN